MLIKKFCAKLYLYHKSFRKELKMYNIIVHEILTKFIKNMILSLVMLITTSKLFEAIKEIKRKKVLKLN